MGTYMTKQTVESGFGVCDVHYKIQVCYMVEIIKY